MKYIKEEDLFIGRKVWACAYDVWHFREKKLLSCKPIQGQICEITGQYSKIGFIPFKGINTLRANSAGVSIKAREYADTSSESIEIYNELVQKRINLLNDVICKTKFDFIGNKSIL